jgi:hypothetical protein
MGQKRKVKLNKITIANITLELYLLKTKKKQEKYYIKTILGMAINYVVGKKT